MHCSRRIPALAASAAILATGAFALSPAHAQVPGGPGSTDPTRPPQPEPRPEPQPPIVALPAPPATPPVIGTPPPPDSPDPPAPEPIGPGGLLSEAPVSLDRLVSGIETKMQAGVGPVGWAYAITQKGKVVGGRGFGFARRPLDGNDDADGVKFAVGTRLELMSTTKSITAIAILKALDDADVAIDAPISPWLPKAWTKQGAFAASSQTPITFRHLLTHTSGIDQAWAGGQLPAWTSGNTWAGMQEIVATGVNPNVAAGESYKNANYALLRVLLAELWRASGGPQSAVAAENHGDRFRSFVNTKILLPSGVLSARCWANFDETAARAYNRANLSSGGVLIEHKGVTTQECGGHRGLHLSALDLVKVATKLRHSTAILSAEQRTAMFDGRLGWKEASNGGIAGSTGIWWHGGDGFFGGGREIHTCLMNAPQGYEIAVVLNSQRPTYGTQCRVLLDAFNEARD